MTRSRLGLVGFTVTAALLLISASAAIPSIASAVQVDLSGSFLYQDRIWNADGYTGGTQDLPIRYADIEVVDVNTTDVLASGSSDEDGAYSISLDLDFSTEIYVRCLSATENHADYHIYVVDTFVRQGGTSLLNNSTIHGITTDSQFVDPGNASSWLFGDYLIEDTTGSGVAQAYNIFDNAIDSIDYLASSPSLGRYPDASEFVVYGWNGTTGSTGSNYQWQGIFIAARATDTDGWADTVILHETGHYVSDLFGRDHNPGGPHILGDSDQDPRLSYGEGYATFFCALVREFRQDRLNSLGDPIDDEVSIYADLSVPPTLPQAGGLEFSYDFETGLWGSGLPLRQEGSANESNVTSVMWDLVDGVGTNDLSPGVDDDEVDGSGELTWEVTDVYMPGRAEYDVLTIDDFHDGWFAQHGEDFLRAELDSIFFSLGQMPFIVDPFEPNDLLEQAFPVVPLTYSAEPGGPVVINELELGEDQIEVYNSGDMPVDLTGWRINTNRNSLPQSSYIFPSFTLYPGAHVVVHAGGDSDDNGPVHLFDTNFIIFWINEDDGACTLRDETNTALDFVRWDNISGSDPSTTPIPPGLSWSGNVDSPIAGKTLGRDKDGTDSDDASDFTEQDFTMGVPNFDVVPRHTIYPEADIDIVRMDLTAGDFLSITATSRNSAGAPVIELLDANGLSSGFSSANDGIGFLAEMNFLAPVDTTVHARVTNEAMFTQYAPVDLAIFRRPSSLILRAPAGFLAKPENTVDVGDLVRLEWLNGGAYDSVHVERDGLFLASLPGESIFYEDTADRGLYSYEVRGYLGGVASASAQAQAFAGTIPCHTGDDFEFGSSNLVLEDNWGLTLFAADGLSSLTDSPPTNYLNNQDASAELIEPGTLLAYPTLEFDHICITEADFDFGHVEISTNFGATWIRLASYDMESYPQWSDGSADPGDWVHETFDLQPYLETPVRIRFRLISDPFLVFDGWYVDNVTLSDPMCEGVTDAPEAPAGGASVERLVVSSYPNPFRDRLLLRLQQPAPDDVVVELFDAAGRRVRTLHDGALGTSQTLEWDGRTDLGHRVTAGVYLLRVETSEFEASERIVRVR